MRLSYPNKKIREISFSMVKTKFKTIEQVIKKVQSPKGMTKLKFRQIISGYYAQMTYMRQNNTFQFKEDPSGKDAHGIATTVHEALLITKILQT